MLIMQDWRYLFLRHALAATDCLLTTYDDLFAPPVMQIMHNYAGGLRLIVALRSLGWTSI
jgi:hypothetical protein